MAKENVTVELPDGELRNFEGETEAEVNAKIDAFFAEEYPEV